MKSFPIAIFKFYKAMFENRDVKLDGKKFPLYKKRGLRRFRIGHLLLIEQNPTTGSRYAKMAKKGREIMWVIDPENDEYLYRVIDGEVKKL